MFFYCFQRFVCAAFCRAQCDILELEIWSISCIFQLEDLHATVGRKRYIEIQTSLFRCFSEDEKVGSGWKKAAEAVQTTHLVTEV